MVVLVQKLAKYIFFLPAVAITTFHKLLLYKLSAFNLKEKRLIRIRGTNV